MSSLSIRIISPTEQRADILGDPLFIALQAASRAEIDGYLAVTSVDLASSNEVHSLTLRAIRYLISRVPG